jgi:hypothetical protein
VTICQKSSASFESARGTTSRTTGLSGVDTNQSAAWILMQGLRQDVTPDAHADLLVSLLTNTNVQKKWSLLMKEKKNKGNNLDTLIDHLRHAMHFCNMIAQKKSKLAHR